MISHNSLPFRARQVTDECEICFVIHDASGTIIVDGVDKANAAYIERACNAYPKLVEALKNLAADFTPGCYCHELDEHEGCYYCEARALLAELEGGE